MINMEREYDGIDYSDQLNKLKVLLPISYLGPVSYYIIILKSENIFFETNEFFVKQSLRNRCSILSANGKQVLSIPKERKSADKTRISEIKISNSHKWQKIHWQALLSSYNSSPFFEHYKDNFFDFCRLVNLLIVW